MLNAEDIAFLHQARIISEAEADAVQELIAARDLKENSALVTPVGWREFLVASDRRPEPTI